MACSISTTCTSATDAAVAAEKAIKAGGYLIGRPLSEVEHTTPKSPRNDGRQSREASNARHRRANSLPADPGLEAD